MANNLFNKRYQYKEPREPSTLAIYLMIVFEMLFESFAVLFLWEWFIVPLGVRSINILHALGIDVLITLIARPRISDDQPYTSRFVDNIFFASFGLIVGFIAHFFI